ncbi:MAG: SDR family NAD(P)-dependent oxidoreductase [Dehalococcoidia bacterium]|nr:SDR family NAD(P)-dependent oxidoreductase [Dehalococcoidia bacterium]
MDIQGKTALVTGAGSGIGQATALRLAREGAAVVVDDVDGAGGGETVRRIEATGGRAALVRADVADEADVRRMVAFARETFGGLDILVNNAGVYISPPYFPDAPVERWSRVVDVYLRGVMLCTHYGIEAMRERGGAIVNISSGAGIGFAPDAPPEYAAAKAGVARLTATLAALRERLHIRVNCVCPGWVDTPASRRTRAEMTEEWELGSVPKEMLSGDDIADAVVELIRDDSLAGRVMLYYRPGRRRLVPVDAE